MLCRWQRENKEAVADGHAAWRREAQCSAGVFMLKPDDTDGYNVYNHSIDEQLAQ